MLTCDRNACGLDRSEHSATAPHPASGCPAYVPKWPCGKCGTDCELHEADAPHPRIIEEQQTCEGAEAPQGFEGGGGGFGGGGASGGW
jgi:hypothetical protein